MVTSRVGMKLVPYIILNADYAPKAHVSERHGKCLFLVCMFFSSFGAVPFGSEEYIASIIVGTF